MREGRCPFTIDNEIWAPVIPQVSEPTRSPVRRTST